MKNVGKSSQKSMLSVWLVNRRHGSLQLFSGLPTRYGRSARYSICFLTLLKLGREVAYSSKSRDPKEPQWVMTASREICRVQRRRRGMRWHCRQPCALLNLPTKIGFPALREEQRTSRAKRFRKRLKWDEWNGSAENMRLEILPRGIGFLSPRTLHCSCMIFTTSKPCQHSELRIVDTQTLFWEQRKA